MKKTLILGCAVVALATAVTSTANANIVTNSKPILFIPQLLIVQGQPIKFAVPIGPGKPVIGFEFVGNYWDDGAGPLTWWASDLQMQITSPAGNKWTVGGFDDLALGASNENWNGWNGSSPGPTAANAGNLPFGAFPNDGIPAAGGPVTLSAIHFPWKGAVQLKEGLWNITFATDFANGPVAAMKWTDVQISLLNIPSPGGIALIGLAGLCALRRRR